MLDSASFYISNRGQVKIKLKPIFTRTNFILLKKKAHPWSLFERAGRKDNTCGMVTAAPVFSLSANYTNNLPNIHTLKNPFYIGIVRSIFNFMRQT